MLNVNDYRLLLKMLRRINNDVLHGRSNKKSSTCKSICVELNHKHITVYLGHITTHI